MLSLEPYVYGTLCFKTHQYSGDVFVVLHLETLSQGMTKLHLFSLWVWTSGCSGGALKPGVSELNVEHHSTSEQSPKKQSLFITSWNKEFAWHHMRYDPASQKLGEVLYWLTVCWFRFETKTNWNLWSRILHFCSFQGPSSSDKWRSNVYLVGTYFPLSTTFSLIFSAISAGQQIPVFQCCMYLQEPGSVIANQMVLGQNTTWTALHLQRWPLPFPFALLPISLPSSTGDLFAWLNIEYLFHIIVVFQASNYQRSQK